MAEEHFLAAGELPSVPLFVTAPYEPPPPQPGLDIAAYAAMLAPYGMLPWASELPSGYAATPTTTAPFDSALSSLVSSPAHASVGDDVAIGDLIGRLGGICSNASANSCYSTPLSSPPRGASQAFRQGECHPPIEAGGDGRLSRVGRSKSPGAADVERSPTTAAGKPGSGAARKRKAASGKGKTVAAVTNGCPKRPKVAGDGNDDVAAAAADDKKPEPVKDYIHVRARRGQATDSHSLAERVRREKISERMKLLQSLVPGCNKITGKALMLDEIINYVQSLQRQVEFLSMKLSAMDPQADVDARYLPSDRDFFQMMMMMHHQPATLGYPRHDAFSYGGDPFAMRPTTTKSSCTGSSACFRPGAGGFGDWETTADHLQSVAHRHDARQRLPSPPAHPDHGFHGGQQRQQEDEAATASHMKAEP